MDMSLIKIENHKEHGLVVSSRTVANQLGKRHDRVLRVLDVIKQTPNLGSAVIPSLYRPQATQRRYKEYLLTKDGFTLYMFNIQGYVDFKMAYINKFNEMEAALKGKLPPPKVRLTPTAPVAPMAQPYQCVDIPDDREAQNLIRAVQDNLLALSQVIKLYNRYLRPDDVEKYREVIKTFSIEILAGANALSKHQPKQIQKQW